MPDFKCPRQGECFGRLGSGVCNVLSVQPKKNKPCPFQKPIRFKRKDGSDYSFEDHIWDYEDKMKAKGGET